MKVIAFCVLTPLFLSSILCMLRFERTQKTVKLNKKQWNNFRWTKRRTTTVRRPTTTTRRLLPGEFQWSPPTFQKVKAPDWWNLYETPQPPHRYSKESFSYDLCEVYKDYNRHLNPTPRPRNECTVKVFYDSYGKLRTMRKLSKYYVEAFRNIHRLDTNSYYYNSEYTESAESSEYIMTSKRKKQPATQLTKISKVQTTRRTTPRRTSTPRRTTILLNRYGGVYSLTRKSKNNTRNSTSPRPLVLSTTDRTMKWFLKITPVLMAEDKFYRREQQRERTPHWGYLITTDGNQTKRKYSFRIRPKTSPIKLIVVRQ